jgi:hypothetical protein
MLARENLLLGRYLGLFKRKAQHPREKYAH